MQELSNEELNLSEQQFDRKSKLYPIFILLALVLALASYGLSITWSTFNGNNLLGIPSWKNNCISMLLLSITI